VYVNQSVERDVPIYVYVNQTVEHNNTVFQYVTHTEYQTPTRDYCRIGILFFFYFYVYCILV